MSCVGARGIVLLLLAMVVGGAAGWAYAERDSEPVISTASPGPVAAADPVLPSTREGVYEPNADLPPVSLSLLTEPARVGMRKDDGIVLPVPVGWDRTYLPGLESKWTAPGNPLGGYQVRVKRLVSENRTPSQMAAELAAAFPFDSSVTDFEVVQQSFDTLIATFTFTGEEGAYRRLTVVRWVSFTGGLVDVEIAATSRIEDRAGMERLVGLMAREVRPLPPPTKAQKPGDDTSSSTS